MEVTIRVIRDDETEHRIGGVKRDDWHGLGDPCPECGHDGFDHFESNGGHYGPHQGAVVERTDYWDANRRLFSRCRGCGEVLYKHPAFELLYPLDGEEDVVINL